MYIGKVLSVENFISNEGRGGLNGIVLITNSIGDRDIVQISIEIKINQAYYYKKKMLDTCQRKLKIK